LFEIVAAVIIAFLIVLLAMPTTIRTLKEKGKVGIDVHKSAKPEVPKGGGYVVLFAIVTSLLVIIGYITFIRAEAVDPALLAALVSILMAGMIGLLDDNLDFRTRTKIALPLIASIPMAVMAVGTTTISIPFVGTVEFGAFYPLIIVPLIMTFIIDSTNMYGGMNGLEAGLAAVNSSAVVSYVFLLPLFTGNALMQSQLDSGTVAAALLGAALAFLIYNKYPAKILPGDVGRLPIGAAIAVALILGNMDRLAIIIFAPFAVNFLLYIIYRIHVKRTGMDYVKFASPREDGTLEVVGPFTMYWVLPHFFKNMTEKKNVLLLVIFQALLAYGTVFLLLIAYPWGVGLF
jgi:UDP-N-acetylglucosamine--dolichyl-phosphate N-acetylglucosaminephosphotransferase